LRTNLIPVLEYKINSRNELLYRYTNCNDNFSMPIKTNFTKDIWIHPTTNWQSINIDKSIGEEKFKIDINFYLRTNKTE
jgi:hypothetical protein